MIEAKLIRMTMSAAGSLGEEIVAEVVSEDDNYIVLKNALVVHYDQSGKAGVIPWATMIDPDSPEIKVSKTHVVYVADLNSDTKKSYNKMYGSKLITPDEKKLIM